jgi:hypothetical protein
MLAAFASTKSEVLGQKAAFEQCCMQAGHCAMLLGNIFLLIKGGGYYSLILVNSVLFRAGFYNSIDTMFSFTFNL